MSTTTVIRMNSNLTVTLPVGKLHDLTKVLSNKLDNTLEIIENYGCDGLDGITIRIGAFNNSDELLKAVKEEVSKKAKKWKRENADCVFLRNQLLVHEGGYDYDYRMSMNDISPEISSFLKEWCRSYAEREKESDDDEEESEDSEEGEESED